MRVGILIDDVMVPRWVRRVVERVKREPWSELCVCVLNDRSDVPQRSALARLRRHPELVLYRLYAALDDRIFGRADDALSPVEIEDLLDGVPRIVARPRRTRYSDYFLSEAVEAVRAERPDVLLRFGFRILRGDILKVPVHGVWSYHHGDNRVNRGGPAGLWEVFHGEPATGVTLQRLTERLDGGQVLLRSLSGTNFRSQRRNNVPSYWKGAAFVSRKLRELASEGAAALEGPEQVDFLPYDRPLYHSPNNRQTAAGVLRIAGRYVRDKWVGAHGEQWCLATSFDEGAPAAYRFRTIVPPRDRFWADPFPIQRADRWYVFLEEFVHRADRGTIACMEIDAKGGWTVPRTVLERPYHLSYPCLFEWKDELFMVPESAQHETVDLYRCTRFPDEWTLEATLLEGVRAVDATLFEWAGRFWIFANQAEPGASMHDELHLYAATSPLGPFVPHPRNPVVSDASCARPAGRPFEWNGRLIRPAQDCTGSYGRAVVFREVLRLDDRGYAEKTVSRLSPDWAPGITGTHTFNRAGRLTVIDLRVRRPRVALRRQ